MISYLTYFFDFHFVYFGKFYLGDIEKKSVHSLFNCFMVLVLLCIYFKMLYYSSLLYRYHSSFTPSITHSIASDAITKITVKEIYVR